MIGALNWRRYGNGYILFSSITHQSIFWLMH
jgi:hypothetical protein